MDPVIQETHEGYFYAYRVLYKNLDDPTSSWKLISNYRRNDPPIHPVAQELAPYTNYSFRVMASSFQSEGLISEAFQERTHQWGMYNWLLFIVGIYLGSFVLGSWGLRLDWASSLSFAQQSVSENDMWVCILAAKSRATIGAGASTSANTTRCSRLSSASILTCRACSQIFGQRRDCSQSILRHPREVLSHCLIDNTSSKMWVCSSECRHGLRTHWCFEVPIFYYANTRDIHNACVPAVAYSIML